MSNFDRLEFVFFSFKIELYVHFLVYWHYVYDLFLFTKKKKKNCMVVHQILVDCVRCKGGKNSTRYQLISVHFFRLINYSNSCELLRFNTCIFFLFCFSFGQMQCIFLSLWQTYIISNKIKK